MYYDPHKHQLVSNIAAIGRVRNVSNPSALSPQEIAERTGLYVAVSEPIPEGHVETGSMSVEIVDGVANVTFDSETIAERDAREAMQEAERIADLAVKHGAALSVLQALLQQIDMSIPCTETEVMARISERIHAGVLQIGGGFIGDMGAAWEAVRQAMPLDDIPKVWAAITAANNNEGE